jgi:hypothetical protein
LITSIDHPSDGPSPAETSLKIHSWHLLRLPWLHPPGLYRDPACLHSALTAGATWAQLAEATGGDEATTRRRYWKWADDQPPAMDPHALQGIDDDEYAAAIKRAEGED